MTEKQSKELLKRACEIITSLEGFIGYNDGDYYNSHLSKSVDNLFDEVDMLNFHPHEDPEVQNSIDEAMGFIQRLKTDPTFAAQWGYNDLGPEYDSAGFTEEDRIVEGQYMNMYKDTDPDLVQLERGEDPNWLFPGEPLHDDDPEDVDEAYEKYVATVKRNIDKAVAEGILKDDCTEGYSYMSKETWLNTQADQEAQDYDTFGNHKI